MTDAGVMMSHEREICIVVWFYFGFYVNFYFTATVTKDTFLDHSHAQLLWLGAVGSMGINKRQVRYQLKLSYPPRFFHFNSTFLLHFKHEEC